GGVPCQEMGYPSPHASRRACGVTCHPARSKTGVQAWRAPGMRYYAAACQTDMPNPRTRDEIPRQVDHMLAMVDRAVLGYAPFFPVRLLAFPEFGHAAPIYPTVDELLDRLAVPIPNEHTDRYGQKARQHGVYIQTA